MPSFVRRAPVQSRVQKGQDIALDRFPVQTCWPGEPAPLITWRSDDGRAWRGSALAMRLPMEGASTLTVAVALDIERHESFIASFRWALIGYVVLAALAFALLARWAAGRALMKVNTP